MRFPFFFLLMAVVAAAPLARAVDDEYLQLKQGNEWLMDAQITSPKGEIINATARRKCGGTEERGGKVYFRVATVTEGAPFPMAYTRLNRRDDTGFYSIDTRDQAGKEDMEVLFPLKIGQTWQRTVGPMTLTNTIVGLETITVNGKTYEKCYHIRVAAADGSYTEDYWEAPNVGSVRSDIVYRSGAKIELTLREFKPGK